MGLPARTPLSDKAIRTAAVLCTLPALLLVASHASADFDDIEINGVYRATSDGQWAKTNDRYHNEATVISTWTVESTCQDFWNCTGTVTSDHGWTANLRYLDNQWRASRTVPDWEKCPDGTTAPGEQAFTFYRDPLNQATLVGWDRTQGPSGACGVNQWLVVEMFFTLVPVN